jgi:hypothetical protein
LQLAVLELDVQSPGQPREAGDEARGELLLERAFLRLVDRRPRQQAAPGEHDRDEERDAGGEGHAVGGWRYCGSPKRYPRPRTVWMTRRPPPASSLLRR